MNVTADFAAYEPVPKLIIVPGYANVKLSMKYGQGLESSKR